MDPKNLRYAKTHEWATLDGNQCTVGITKFAVEQLTDIVYVELPDVGDNVFAGDSFGEIESVKAVSDLIAPLSGEVLEVNDKVVQAPETVNEDPYGEGWRVTIRVAEQAEADALMDAEAYKTHLSTL